MILNQFRQFYSEERENVHILTQRLRESGRCTVSVSGPEAKQLWNPPLELIFHKVDLFDKRLACIIHIFQLIQEFSRLSRVELSSMGGRSLTAQLQIICRQFCELKAPIVGGLHGDCMDPDNQVFETAVNVFLTDIGQLENQLTSIVGNSLSDATTPLNAFRIIQLLGSFMERPAMVDKVKQSHARLVRLAADDIVTCLTILKTNRFSDEPDVVGSMQLILQVEKRAKIHMTACQNIGIDSKCPGMKTLQEKYQLLQNVTQSQTGEA